MKNRFFVKATLLIVVAVLGAMLADRASAYDILSTKWEPGVNTASFNTPSGTPGGATWSAMASGLSGNAAGFDGHGDLSTDIEFLITPAADGLEYGLFNDALNVWASHASFTNLGQVADGGAATGAPEGAGGHLGDIRAAGFSFDGAGGGLAHALQPATQGAGGTTFGGDVHFDIAENWTNGGGGGTDFLTVAIHELGHSLGLGHSGAQSVMQPFYAGTQHNLYLDDILGIQAIYGTDFNANPSFDSVSDTNVLNIDFGTFNLGDPVAPITFDVSNLQAASSTAVLSHSSTNGSGDTGTLTTDFSGLSNLLAGSTSSTFNAMFDTNTPGLQSASYDLNFTDNTGGNQSITLNLMGNVDATAPANFDDPARPDLLYNPATGEVFIDPRDIATINLYLLESDYDFIGLNHTPFLAGVATSDDHVISEAAFSSISVPTSAGTILAAGLTYDDLYFLFDKKVATSALGQPEIEFDIDFTCGMGDTNCDGYVDIANDIFPAFSGFTGPGTFSVLRGDGDVDGVGNAGDDDVDVSDLLAIFSAFTGPAPDEGGLSAPAELADPNIPDLIYNPATGEVVLDVDGSGIIGYVLKNASGTFAFGSHLQILAGVKTSVAGELSEAAFATSVGANSIGNVFPLGMDLAALTAYLTVNDVSRSLGAPVVPFDLVVLGPAVPEPSTVVLAAFGLIAMGFVARRKKLHV